MIKWPIGNSYSSSRPLRSMSTISHKKILLCYTVYILDRFAYDAVIYEVRVFRRNLCLPSIMFEYESSTCSAIEYSRLGSGR